MTASIGVLSGTITYLLASLAVRSRSREWA